MKGLITANGWCGVDNISNLPNETARQPIETLAPPSFRRGIALSPSLVTGFVALSDGVAVATASLLFFSSYIDSWAADTLKPYLSLTGLNTCLVLQSFAIAGLYRFDALIRPRPQLVRIAIVCIQ